ncbi:MAG TPA: hypothetical protein VKU90_07540 [Caulobacteraceae bacterium]|nr:hypothetical protein [Caulobacteraceae bacterium]
MTRFVSLCLVLAAAGAVAAPALAQGGPRTACAADMAKLCPGVQPGNGAIRQCMMSHASELSDGCKAAIAAARAAHGH